MIILLCHGKFVVFHYIFAGTFPLLFGQAQLCRWETIFGVVRSFVWHIIIVWTAIICLSMRPIGKDIKSNWKPLVGAVGIFFCCNLIAQTINLSLHYGGGLNYPVPLDAGFKDEIYASSHQFDPDTAGCFYISPWMKSVMPVYRDVWVKAGWLFNWIFYYLTFSLGAVLIYFLFYIYHRLVNYITNQKQLIKVNEKI